MISGRVYEVSLINFSLSTKLTLWNIVKQNGLWDNLKTNVFINVLFSFCFGLYVVVFNYYELITMYYNLWIQFYYYIINIALNWYFLYTFLLYIFICFFNNILVGYNFQNFRLCSFRIIFKHHSCFYFC